MTSKIKRFYKEVDVIGESEGVAVTLDGRAVRTPAKAKLALPTEALARAIAAEWSGQGAEVQPAAMPLMQLACTALDTVAANRDRVVGDVASYGEHELLCYWTADQPELAARQQAQWQPLLDWAALTLDAPLTVTKGVAPVVQPPQAMSALAAAVTGDDFELMALAAAVQAAGSLVIGLALCRGEIDAAAAFEAAQLEESYQIELWGEDREALERREAIRAELVAARRFLDLLQG